MSKFTYSDFYGGGDIYFAVSKEKYTKEQAIQLAVSEIVDIEEDVGLYLSVKDAYVTHRAGVDEYGHPQVSWWLEPTKRPKRSVPVWKFEVVYRYITDRDNGEYILIGNAGVETSLDMKNVKKDPSRKSSG